MGRETRETETLTRQTMKPTASPSYYWSTATIPWKPSAALPIRPKKNPTKKNTRYEQPANQQRRIEPTQLPKKKYPLRSELGVDQRSRHTSLSLPPLLRIESAAAARFREFKNRKEEEEEAEFVAAAAPPLLFCVRFDRIRARELREKRGESMAAVTVWDSHSQSGAARRVPVSVWALTPTRGPEGVGSGIGRGSRSVYVRGAGSGDWDSGVGSEWDLDRWVDYWIGLVIGG